MWFTEKDWNNSIISKSGEIFLSVKEIEDEGNNYEKFTLELVDILNLRTCSIEELVIISLI